MVLRLLGLGDRIGMKILTIHSTDGHRLSINKVRIGVGGRRHPSPLCMLTLFCCLGYTFVDPAIAFYFYLLVYCVQWLYTVLYMGFWLRTKQLLIAWWQWIWMALVILYDGCSCWAYNTLKWSVLFIKE